MGLYCRRTSTGGSAPSEEENLNDQDARKEEQNLEYRHILNTLKTAGEEKEEPNHRQWSEPAPRMRGKKKGSKYQEIYIY